MPMNKATMQKLRNQHLEFCFKQKMKAASDTQFKKCRKYAVVENATGRIVKVCKLEEFTAWAGPAMRAYTLV